MEQMQVFLWKKSIKVVACAFQMCGEPPAPSNESRFCWQLKGKGFCSRLAVAPEVLLNTRTPTNSSPIS